LIRGLRAFAVSTQPGYRGASAAFPPFKSGFSRQTKQEGRQRGENA